MSKTKRLIALLIAVFLTLGILAGCSNDAGKVEENEEQVESLSEETGEEQLDEEQKFVYSSASEITGLNPLVNTTGPDNGLHSIVLETLVAKVADEEGKQIIKPAAAEDWTISEDGLVYTFNIREDAVWSDGVPVTAHDFVYTFRQMATPEVGSTNAWLFDGVIENFTEALYEGTKSPEEIGVRAIDDKTVEFTLVKPYGYFLELLDGAKPIRQDKWEEWGGEYGSSIDKAIFNGPFIVKEWQPNVQMTLVKNENYWDAENVKLQKIERKVIKDTATAAQALLNGEIDVLSTNDADWKGVISEDDRFNLITQRNAPEFLGFNCANKYFKNPKIRLAFSLAIDREKYNQDLENGESIPLYSLMPPITNVETNCIVKGLMERTK